MPPSSMHHETILARLQLLDDKPSTLQEDYVLMLIQKLPIPGLFDQSINV